jgi:hypothetical protein
MWLPRCVCLSLLLLAAAFGNVAAAAAPSPEVRIERDGDAYAITAEVAVAVTRPTAWAVITDYDRWGDFVADIDESRVVSRAGEPTLVRQTGVWRMFGLRVPVRILSQVEERPMQSVRFHSIGGNVRVEHGEWSIAEQGTGVAITYRVQCTPDFWVPPVIDVLLIRRDVRAKLEQVAQEMLRRDAVARKQPLPLLLTPAS